MPSFQRIANEWIKPSFVAGAFVALCYYQIQLDVALLKDAVRDLRGDIDRSLSHGSDGFLDPQMHGAVDQHLEHWGRELLGTRGWRNFVTGHDDGSRTNKE
jgi:hypothetical protein